jgi:hypothetical protein
MYALQDYNGASSEKVQNLTAVEAADLVEEYLEGGFVELSIYEEEDVNA